MTEESHPTPERAARCTKICSRRGPGRRLGPEVGDFEGESSVGLASSRTGAGWRGCDFADLGAGSRTISFAIEDLPYRRSDLTAIMCSAANSVQGGGGFLAFSVTWSIEPACRKRPIQTARRARRRGSRGSRGRVSTGTVLAGGQVVTCSATEKKGCERRRKSSILRARRGPLSRSLRRRSSSMPRIANDCPGAPVSAAGLLDLGSRVTVVSSRRLRLRIVEGRCRGRRRG